jgi:hypothetical protein
LSVRARPAAALVLALLALALGACGDDEEPAGSTTATTEQRGDTTPTDTTAGETTLDAPSSGAGDDKSEGGGMTAPSKGSGEDSPSGAGDEVPASSQALFTGRDGRLQPTVIHVPSFIAVRVELVSRDGVEYELETPGGRKIEAGGEIRSASTLLDGLRTGERVVLTGPQGKVTIVADAEPGP